jgi:Sporulation initiation factor Spo0A C terminal.
MNERTLTVDALINASLRALHVPPELLGYRYLFLAAHLVLTCDPRQREAVRRTLYARIGACMGTTKPMIDRSIRYAVAQAWKNADREVLRSYLGRSLTGAKDPPANQEFIWLVIERVRLIAGVPFASDRRGLCGETD